MKQNQIEELIRIYNTLLQIPTSGQPTIFMGEALKALYGVIDEAAKEAGLELQKGEEAASEEAPAEEVQE